MKSCRVAPGLANCSDAIRTAGVYLAGTRGARGKILFQAASVGDWTAAILWLLILFSRFVM
jgi:hypothetical protein